MRTAIRIAVVLATMLALLAPSATLVSAAGISVSPNSGAIGTTTSVSGSGFANNTTVHVVFNGSGGTQIGVASSDGSGNLAGFNVGIPNVVAGTYQIFATDGTNIATTTFTVPSSLTLSPSSGGPTTGVSVSGTGFLSGEDVSIAWDQAGNQLATATFSVPNNSSGMHTVLATGQRTHFALSATFSVSGDVGANLSVNPTTAAAGSSLTLSGSGFNANEQVNLAVDNGEAMSLMADGSGNFSTSIFLSPSWALGQHTISATGVGSGHVAFATFSVTSSTATALAQSTTSTSTSTFCEGDTDDSMPGNGFGDPNHCHNGPPGQDQGHGHGHGHGHHGDGNDQGGGGDN